MAAMGSRTFAREVAAAKLPFTLRNCRAHVPHVRDPCHVHGYYIMQLHRERVFSELYKLLLCPPQSAFPFNRPSRGYQILIILFIRFATKVNYCHGQMNLA